jgi:hypothetical protein
LITYNNVAQIYDAIDETRNRIYSRVEDLSDEESRHRASAGAWSVAEIIEHLSKIEGRLLKMMTMMLRKAEAVGARSGDRPVEIKPFTMEKFIEATRNEKFTAPEPVHPEGHARLTDSLEKLRASRAELHNLRPRIEMTNLAGATYPHPVGTSLNFYEWLAFIGLHEERHLRQIERVLAANGKY